MKALLKINTIEEEVDLPITSDFSGNTIKLNIGDKIIDTGISTTKIVEKEDGSVNIVIKGETTVAPNPNGDEGDYVIDFGDNNESITIDPDDIEEDD